jgi:methyltransferase (TIGR00027 family)
LQDGDRQIAKRDEHSLNAVRRALKPAMHGMRLPDSSNAFYVAFLRYLQSIHEAPPRRNPDNLVRHFIPPLRRWRAKWLGTQRLERLRADPFYLYLAARTRYYDQVFTAAIADGVRQIIAVGCGSDTRAYRFRQSLLDHKIHVLECDQADALEVKRRVARRWNAESYVQYLALDLNDDGWPALSPCIERTGAKALLFLEGVSPYVNHASFTSFLRTMASHLPPGSRVAYDYKLRGVRDDFGKSVRTLVPFRLPAVAAEVAAFHERLRLRLDSCELSSELTGRLVPGVRESGAPLFDEDGLARLTVVP